MVVNTIDVESSSLDKGLYRSHQTIDTIREYVELRDKDIYVKYDARISIDNTILNESDWVTFTFSPVLYDTDKISSFKSSIGLQTSDWGGGDVFIPNKKANYKMTNESNGYFSYNVSLKNLKGRNAIIFKTNYTISNRVFRIKDFTYGFFYHSRVEALNNNIYFRFPNNLEFTHIKDRDKLKQGSGFQDYEVTNDETKEVFNFIFDNLTEKENLQFRRDVKYIGFGTILGAIVSLLLTILYERIPNRNKLLIGNIKIKKFKNFQRVIIQIFKNK